MLTYRVSTTRSSLATVIHSILICWAVSCFFCFQAKKPAPVSRCSVSTFLLKFVRTSGTNLFCCRFLIFQILSLQVWPFFFSRHNGNTEAVAFSFLFFLRRCVSIVSTRHWKIILCCLGVILISSIYFFVLPKLGSPLAAHLRIFLGKN